MNIKRTYDPMSMLSRPALLVAALVLAGGASAQNNIAVNNTGLSPVSSAILDISSSYTGAASKGLLIPRVASVASITVGAGEDGMLVYQSGGVPGYYYWNASLPAWVRVQTGGEGWEIWGNNIAVNPNQKWFGTRDNTDVVFRTNNVERMRLSDVGNLGVNNAAPTELLDVTGALRLWPLGTARSILGAVPYGAPVPGYNMQYSAADNVGTVTYQKDSVRALAGGRTLMQPGHYGQTFAAAGGIAAGAPVPNIGGWRKLENDYNEVFNAPYELNTATCGTVPGTVEIPSQPLLANSSNFGLTGTTVIATNTITAIPSTVNLSVGMVVSGVGIAAGSQITSIVNATTITISINATLSSIGVLTYTNTAVSPYLNNAPSVGKRYRKQFMILRNELNPELNQLQGINGVARPLATQGLCPGATITSVQFWVNQAIAVAQQKNWSYSLIVKHAPFGLNNLFGGFDNNVDPAGGCLNQVPVQARPGISAVAAWDVFTLTTPFVWDGQRNIIIELAVDVQNTASAGLVVPVKYYTIPGVSPANLLTYSQEGQVPQPGLGCNSIGASPCNAGITGSGMPNTGCAAFGGTFGPNSQRPAIRFGVSTGAASITPSTGATVLGPYLQYEGGLVVELTVPSPTPPWGWQTVPYYAYKGPNTLSAERGVYDGGVRLNDHVFDRYFDGRVKPEDASSFGDRGVLSIGEMASFMQQNRHLPTVKGREDWQREGSFSIGDMTNQLWATTESQALYITELNDRMNALEILSGERPITQDEFDLTRRTVASMSDLSEQEKARLVQDLDERVIPAIDQH